jgi:hypothetical protein
MHSGNYLVFRAKYFPFPSFWPSRELGPDEEAGAPDLRISLTSEIVMEHFDLLE